MERGGRGRRRRKDDNEASKRSWRAAEPGFSYRPGRLSRQKKGGVCALTCCVNILVVSLLTPTPIENQAAATVSHDEAAA